MGGTGGGWREREREGETEAPFWSQWKHLLTPHQERAAKIISASWGVHKHERRAQEAGPPSPACSVSFSFPPTLFFSPLPAAPPLLFNFSFRPSFQCYRVWKCLLRVVGAKRKPRSRFVQFTPTQCIVRKVLFAKVFFILLTFRFTPSLRWFKYGINEKEDGREETFVYDNVDKNQVLSCKKFN